MTATEKANSEITALEEKIKAIIKIDPTVCDGILETAAFEALKARVELEKTGDHADKVTARILEIHRDVNKAYSDII